MAFVYQVELTNLCNLVCSYCPLTYSERPKGYMTMETYLKVIAHMKKANPLGCLILHHFGEPLLHPELVSFVEIAGRAGLNSGFSTNGDRLDDLLFERLIQAGLIWMCISFHTEEGRKAYERYREAARRRGLVLWGRELVHEPTTPDPAAILGYGVERQGLHSFAGTLPDTPRSRPHDPPACDFLEHRFVAVLYDGRVVPCCMDEKGRNVIGTVDELDRIRQRPGYDLCRSCEGIRFLSSHREIKQQLEGA
jgi:hypothetical protein